MSNPSTQEIFDVTRKAVSIFSSHGLDSCLVGGAGCVLFGCTRTPHDVDLVVLTNSYTTESLKSMLVRTNSDFYLRPSRKIGATYKILYCRVGSMRSCKVDILTPGIMNIPTIPSPVQSRLTFISGIPIMPFIPLLLLKLQAWQDHRESIRSDYNQKQHTDVVDIQELLEIGIRKKLHLRDVRGWLGETFINDGQRRVLAFCSRALAGREVTGNFKRVGFSVPNQLSANVLTRSSSRVVPTRALTSVSLPSSTRATAGSTTSNLLHRSYSTPKYNTVRFASVDDYI